MLAQTPIGQRFYNWVNSQPPDLRYQYTSCTECACGRFLIEEMGFTPYSVTIGHPCHQDHFNFPRLEIKAVWDQFDRIAGGDDHEDWTFGKLAERIRERMPECVA
jgi:hypothetical protein